MAAVAGGWTAWGAAQEGGAPPKKAIKAAPTDPSQDEENEAFDPMKLPGEWLYKSGWKSGEESQAEVLAGVVTITKETFKLPAGPDTFFLMAYTLDAKKNPATIDFEIKEGPVPEGKAVGIIKFEDDELHLCYDPTGQKRPEKFESTEENGAHLFILKRQPKEEDDSKKGDLKDG
jgi:uncharacterized protein (TIGR03067 family)